MKLYSIDLSPFAARVRTAIYFKNLNVECVAPPGGTKSDDYLAINPMGKMPVLVLDDESVLPESEVIVEYLEDLFPTPSLRPASAKDRAHVRLLARVVASYVDAPLFMLFPQISATPRDPDLIASQLKRLDEGLKYLAIYLAPDGYAFGREPTTADCLVFPTIYLVGIIANIFAMPGLVAQHPRITAYYERAKGDPVLARVLQEMEAGMQAANHG